MRPTAIDRTGLPTPPDSSDGGGGNGWRLLTTAKDRVTAHLIEGRLAQEGIETFLDTRDASPGAFLKPFGDPLAPVRVLVKQSDYETATLLLFEADHQSADPDASGPRRVKWLWLATVAAILAVSILLFLETFGDAPCFVGICVR